MKNILCMESGSKNSYLTRWSNGNNRFIWLSQLTLDWISVKKSKMYEKRRNLDLSVGWKNTRLPLFFLKRTASAEEVPNPGIVLWQHGCPVIRPRDFSLCPFVSLSKFSGHKRPRQNKCSMTLQSLWSKAEKDLSYQYFQFVSGNFLTIWCIIFHCRFYLQSLISSGIHPCFFLHII